MKYHPIKTIYILLFPLLFLFAIALIQNRIFGNTFFDFEQKESYDITIDQAKKVFPKTTSIQSYGAFHVANHKDQTLGYLGHSAYYSPYVRGYNGKVPIIVAMDTSFVIKGIIVLPNKETGDFVEILRKRNFFDSWNNISILEITKFNIDAISGATQTSDAISKNLHNTIEGMNRLLELDLPHQSNQWRSKNLFQYIIQICLLVLALLSFFSPLKFRKYRLLLLGLNVIVFGFWSSTMLTQTSLYNGLINGINTENQLIWLIILAISILIPIITNKNIYCQHICPMGSIQELCYKLPNKKVNIGNRSSNTLKLIRKVYFLIIMGTLLTGWSLDLSKTEPFIAFRFNIASTIMLFFFVCILLFSTIINKPWCKYLCPTGFTLELLRKK
ncbi:4Fe-4S binding protein [Carboxylicivirga sp. N1Y90]|uniref:FMN-binding protein n=1 Tax=Carboxylicivirga fragile TaxID=3417571 RepID=UPI003D353134|nr:4Fe-4S binding protein [Marinilabiliaceae bacterium N1Y90]